MSDRLRLRFSKTGKAKYISHLDLMATMRRALLRAGIRMSYSEGYNPHPYISFALPLSVGCGSVCELVDFGTADRLLPDGLPDIINAALPDGLEVTDAYKPERKFSGIKWVEINGVFCYDKEKPQDAPGSLSERFKSESIIVAKKTKRGVSDIDIAPHIRDLEFFEDDNGANINIKVKLSAQNPTINPENLISALGGGHSALMPDFALFTRMEVFDKEMNVFR